jgi:hypothetical protein
MRKVLLFFIPILVAACAASPAPSAPPPAAPTPPVTPAVEVAATTNANVSPPVVDAFSKLPPSLPIPSPGGGKAVARSGNKWPFHKWDHAEAVALNWMPYSEKTSERVYEDNGWSPNVKYRIALGAEQAELANHFVQYAKGELLVTKCPNPHHAVVFYDGETVVGSVSVGFQCPDVLLWPRWPSKYSDKALEIEAMDSSTRWSFFFFESDMVRLPEVPPELRME